MTSNAEEDDEIIELGEPIAYISNDYSYDQEELLASQIQAFMFQQMLEMGYLPYPPQFPHDLILSHSPVFDLEPVTAVNDSSQHQVYPPASADSHPVQPPKSPYQFHPHPDQLSPDANKGD